jgi:hypothetical protein
MPARQGGEGRGELGDSRRHLACRCAAADTVPCCCSPKLRCLLSSTQRCQSGQRCVQLNPCTHSAAWQRGWARRGRCQTIPPFSQHPPCWLPHPWQTANCRRAQRRPWFRCRLAGSSA